jgi:plasmid stability protein
MCQMCDEYEAELRRMGIAMDEKVTVDLDHELASELERRASEHGHTVSDEVRTIVKEAVKPPPKQIDWIARAREISAMTPPGSIRVDSWKIIRASRDWDH